MAGIQASAWLVVLIVAAFGYDWIAVLLPKLDGWEFLIAVMVIAFWYSLGIIVDRVGSILVHIFDPKNMLLKVKWIKQRQASNLDVARIRLFLEEDRQLTT